MTKISKIKKLFYFFILLGVILQVSIIYQYYNINQISAKMLFHRTTVIKNLSNIKFFISEAHLWVTEYVSGDQKKRSRIDDVIRETQNSFDILIMMEKSKKPIVDLVSRDSKAILEELLNVEKQWQVFKQQTYLNIKYKYKVASTEDIKYDKTHSLLLNDLLEFENKLDITFSKVLREFKEYQNKVYIFMIALFITITSFFYIVMRRVLRQLRKIERQDKMIEQQSKMAAMGEMIDSIAHQWKQPVGVLKMKIQMLELDIKDNNLNKSDTQTFINSSIKQINHLQSTMDEFRTFFRPNVEVDYITLNEIIESSLLLMEDDLVQNNISTKIIGDIQTAVYVSPSEFKHIIINIVNNTKDAYVEKNTKVENRNITFGIINNEENIELLISDHAGGIDNTIIDKIFQANFTTKEEGKGTGIGLYMSKQIAQKNNATISAQNLNDGAMFKITIPKLDR